MFAAVDVPIADGALWRLPFRDARFAKDAELVVDGLHYANGLVLDEQGGYLYLSECVGNRVPRFHVDVATGRLDEQSTLLEIPLPDNLDIDRDGRLWVALPVRNELIVVDTGTGEYHSAFRVQSTAQAETAAEFVRRGNVGQPRMELFTPTLWAPLSGAVTGLILGPDGPLYLTGLGDALVRLDS